MLMEITIHYLQEIILGMMILLEEMILNVVLIEEFLYLVMKLIGGSLMIKVIFILKHQGNQ